MILRFMQTHLAISRRILSISLAWNVNLDQWIDYTFVCSRMLNVPIEDVEKVMQDLKLELVEIPFCSFA